MLRIAAIFNFILAVGHIVCMPWLFFLFRLYGIDGMMTDIATYGEYLPYLITVVIAVCFALCGIYALSAAGTIVRLPLLWTGIFAIAAIFLFRAIIGCVWMVQNDNCPITDISSVIISGGIGMLYLIGGIKHSQEIKK